MGKDELLKKYLEGKLTDEEERQALHLFAEDQVMRRKLRMEHTLFSSLNTLLHVGMCSERIHYINSSES